MAEPGHPPRILIRADARRDLGGGHIMRCLALARSLTQRGAEIAFACAPGSADLVPALARSGYPVLAADHVTSVPMPSGWHARADAIFVDLYDSRQDDETALRSSCSTLAVIEDLPDRTHDCDLLVDQGVGRQARDYAGRVPPGTRLLLGPDMVPLRPDFAASRASSLARRDDGPKLARVLIAMGLTDLGGISARVTRLVHASLPDVQIDVVLGPSAASLSELQSFAEQDPRVRLHVDVDDMAVRMASADLAIGAGGGTALERCVLGLPSFIIVLAENQRPSARLLGEAGAGWVLEDLTRLDRDLPDRLHDLDADALNRASRAARQVCDGRGADQIATALLDLVSARRRASA